jgi:hypothetical protein
MSRRIDSPMDRKPATLFRKLTRAKGYQPIGCKSSFATADGASRPSISTLPPVEADLALRLPPAVSLRVLRGEASRKASVVVAGRDGMPKVVIVRDGPRGVGPEVARRKAYTAAMQRVSTGDFTKRVSAPGAFNPGMYDKELFVQRAVAIDQRCSPDARSANAGSV